MIRGVGRRIIVGVALFAVGLFALAGAPAAHAAPEVPPAPTSVTISGDDLAEPLVVVAEQQPEIFTAVMDQVNWLDRAWHAAAPKPETLGPKYVLVVSIEDRATETYDLYPLAGGGPRAFRPAKQPDKRKTAEAWFFGRLSMPEALRVAGAPLPEQNDAVSAGIGGGERAIPEDALRPGDDLDEMFADLREVLLMNAAVVVVITLGLAGIALLVRRRTR
ncbi:hypothetical protein [Polymorphospora sp. NPDC050346]|uniref:hypothetical protein n=1 Tax=Polymorphospora sp. NPDC050346 TaxID=3155780 RepID=UPI0033C37F7C